MDTLLAVALAAFSIPMLWWGEGDVPKYLPQGIDFRDPDALGVMITLAATIPLAWRRRAPIVVINVVGVAAIMLSATNYASGLGLGGIGVLIALYSVATQCSRGMSKVALGITLLGTLMAFLVASYDLTRDVFITNFIVFVTAWALGDNLRTRRRYVAELEQKASRLETEREQNAARAVAEERSRIARELHDVVAHNVSVMVVLAGGARRTMDRNPKRVPDVLESIESTGRQALGEMRRLLGVLRADDEATDARTPQPGVSRLDDLVQTVRTAGLPVDVQIEGAPAQLSAGVELSAYRIVQEALTNALKHAGPATAEVVLRYADDALEVSVRDNGRGSSAAVADAISNGRANGHGIAGMRERVTLFGGELRTGPRRGGGYEVVATLPLAADA
jgi:signal transduction histidine kinase